MVCKRLSLDKHGMYSCMRHTWLPLHSRCSRMGGTCFVVKGWLSTSRSFYVLHHVSLSAEECLISNLEFCDEPRKLRLELSNLHIFRFKPHHRCCAEDGQSVQGTTLLVCCCFGVVVVLVGSCSCCCCCCSCCCCCCLLSTLWKKNGSITGAALVSGWKVNAANKDKHWPNWGAIVRFSVTF